MLNLLRASMRTLTSTIAKLARARKVTEKDIDQIIYDSTPALLSAGIYFEVVDEITRQLKSELVGKEIPREISPEEYIRETLKNIIRRLLNTPTLEIEDLIKKSIEKKKPFLIVFLGFNGVGKSLTLAKIGYLLRKKGFRVLVAAGDTYRSAAIEQLEEYSQMAGLPIVKQKRGSDSCSVVYQAVEKAKSKYYNVVLADTAGRSHLDKNLIEELRKIVRVNNPDLKVLVLDSLSGADAISQLKAFDKNVGVDALIFTKLDANPKGGVIISIAALSKKPIIYIGVGGKIEDLEPYNPEIIIDRVFSWD